MELAEYLSAFRRRWHVVLLAIVVAVAVAFGVNAVVPASAGSIQHKATAILLYAPASADAGVAAPLVTANLNTLAALVTIGEVPSRAANALKSGGRAPALAENVQASADTATGLLEITARAPSRKAAKARANIFARELINYQRSPPLNYMGGGLQLVQRATLEPVSATSTRFEPLQSRSVRLGIAGILGLLAGIVIVLVLERFDTKIRTEEGAERHFGLPVLTTIPFVPWFKRGILSPAAGRTRTPLADRFRFLATSIAMGPTTGETKTPTSGAPASPHAPGSAARATHGEPGLKQQAAPPAPSGLLPRGGNGSGRDSVPITGQPRTILVTSAGRAEGKSTVVANLAASFADLGMEVMVLSCDFRRPRVHDFFGISKEPGLAEALNSMAGGPLVNGLAQRTSLSNVHVVPSGSPPYQPGKWLTSKDMRTVLQEAITEADVVLIDSAPVFATGETTLLFSQVDAVLVVARVGKTTAEVAERMSEFLSRMHSPVVGLALNRSTEKRSA